ncbi:creatininase family protein [Arthrobacter sp. NPDC058127]|uniref:creatininase family protein n=1 Tax=Arthrobacter sp. NPDC058127 TaxID=3346351 RepID=UPI0036EA23DD
MRWAESTMAQLAAADLPARIGLVPVGATEQHGPHLPTDTDTRIALALCAAVEHRRPAETIVLPPITVGSSLGHGTAFPGTLSLFPEELSRILVRYAEWSAFSGLTRLLFVNGHMGNATPLASATDVLRFRRPDLRSSWIDWWCADELVAALVGADGQDIHANRAETSVVLHLNPELVDTEAMLAADDPDRTGGLAFRYTAESLSTNGVTGAPSQATPELGHQIFNLIVDVIDCRVAVALVESAPVLRSADIPRPTWI